MISAQREYGWKSEDLTTKRPLPRIVRKPRSSNCLTYLCAVEIDPTIEASSLVL